MQVTIRPAHPGDAAEVAAILEDSYPALMCAAYDPDILSRALPLMTRPQPRLLAGGTYYLAEEDGEAVGCGGWASWLPGADRTQEGLAHIRHFAVRSRFAGRGAGRALYDRCESDARTMGAHRFEVQSSLNAEPFYAALGFQRMRQIEVTMAPGLVFPSILMERGI